MEPVQTTTHPMIQTKRDEMNNEISSTSTENVPKVAGTVKKYNHYYKRYTETTVSDNEAETPRNRTKSRMTVKNHHKSMGNIHDEYNYDIDFMQKDIKKYDTLRIPIVGYEVMEERARFTIYKLKVEDDKTDKSWLVFRRYTDFVRLFSRIKAEMPNLILPLPGKRWFKNNFDPAFLDDRVRGLQVFVNAVLSKLPEHPVVREFFCLDEPPQVFSYQPEVQAVYGALEDSLSSLKMQLKQKDVTISDMQKRLDLLEEQVQRCDVCSTKLSHSS